MQIKFLLFVSLCSLLSAVRVRQNHSLSSQTAVARLNGTWERGQNDNMPSNALVVGY